MRPVHYLAACSRTVMVLAAVSVGLPITALGMATPAFAIPSPELIVGSFTSISQLIALLSATLGGGAALVGIRAGAKPGTSRRAWQIATGAIVCVFVSLAVNFYQYSSAQNERQSRLEATLTRPTPKIDGRALDPTLKEVSYQDQLNSSRGIRTSEAERLLEATQRGERDDIVFIDIREPAERELGSLPGAKAVRFPDLARTNLNLSGKTAIFLCHNGNRSYETCAALAAKGIDCRFMVGGLEKWLMEQRSLTGMKARTLADLRALPSYRNQAVLLDTDDVHKLLQAEGAIFVDVRYPGEFASSHLPGAINLPIRPTPSDELRERISKIPHRPIIAPCYDRRSCFFAELLGLELDRAGYDFRGRYTVPWELFAPRKPPPYIQQWLQEAQKTWWDKLVTLLAELVRATAQYVGFPIVILLLAIASRLFVLPISVKAERDQIRSRAASDELKEIKIRLAHDPVQRTRAIQALYARLGLTPVRNLLALLFLPIMAVALSAVQQAVSADGGGRFLWIPELGEHDSFLILPILFGALLAIYLEIAFSQSVKHRIVIWAVAFPLLVATGFLFTAGADLYLVASAALLLLQRIVVAGKPIGLGALWRRFRLGKDVISLDEPDLLSPYGNKAYRLAQMRSHGLPVPDGVLLTPSFLKDFAYASTEWRRHRLDRIWRWLGRAPVVVRSSAIGEDNGQHSFAGVFESVLNVNRDGLEAAITKVMASFAAGRAKSYVADGGSGSVLIQRMIDAEYAGVLFTRDPAAGGLTMIESVRGTAEDFVSGAVRPATYRFGRVSGTAIGELDPPLDLKTLHAFGLRAERLFGAPQDIEWTYHTGRFYLVQSRDITRAIVDESDVGLARREMACALDLAEGLEAGEVAFGKNEFAEMLPRPTPLSLSLMEALWESGGSVDLASRKLGLSYQVTDRSADYFVTILGRLYVNRREERARVLNVGTLAARRLNRNAMRIEQEFRESFLPRFLAEIRLMEVADFDKLSTTELLDEIARLRDRFILDTHVEVDVINIAASFYLERARRELNAHQMDASMYLSHIPETDEARALAEMAVLPPENRRAALLATMGHRAVLDYELSEPRYREDPSALDRMAAFRSVDCSAHVEDVEPDGARPGKLLKRSVEIARRFQALKEDAKHHSLRELAILRQAILALDRRLQLGGLSFFLRFDELIGLRARPVNELREIATRRREERARMIEMAPLAPTLSVRDLEVISAGGDAVHHQSGDSIRGTRVSGKGIAEGRARIIPDADAERGNLIENFEDGDIIVASMVHPSWLPYFPRAGGFICEVGGWLSHTAILAREYEVPMIVNTTGMAAIKDRSLLRLRPDGIIEVLGDQDFVRAVAAE